MATSSFDWTQALTGSRLRASGSPARGDEGNQFLSDYYRVAFSSAFRRLQDKTQVNPLADTDFVRRRLTHSVEVATVGERMGRVTATRLQDRLQDDHREAFGRIIATASLLHDIGNPPFGHEGEVAIREWADRAAREYADYRCFDGNAQGFRVAVRLQHHGKPYGMNLTAATLASTLKYPWQAQLDEAAPPARNRKGFSILDSELQTYEKVADLVGLDAGRRHPLCLLVEAADDIVNRLVDLEDGIKLGLVAYQDILDVLDSVGCTTSRKLLREIETRRRSIDSGTKSDKEQLAYQHFRAECIAEMADACEVTFVSRVSDVEDGSLAKDLIEHTELSGLYSALKALEYGSIFGDSRIVRVEAGGRTAVTGLLDQLIEEVRRETKLGDTIPRAPLLPNEEDDVPRRAVECVIDYVAGMTDRFAIDLYQELSGVSL